MGAATTSSRPGTRGGHIALLGALGALLAACGGAPRVSVQSAVSSLPDPVLHLRDDSLQRLRCFGALHDTVRLLIIAQGGQAEWAERGVLSVPLESCAQAVGYRSSDANACTLVSLADGETAVLVMSQSEDCDRAMCLEQSWVFLNDQGAPVLLPPRRASDYGSLRADLSREVAEALWLAGYRGRRDTRTAQADDPYAAPDPYADERPEIASYASCVRAPRSSELVCRSREGHLIGLDPLSAVERVIARLELDARAGTLSSDGLLEPPFFTPDGRLAVAVQVENHALCGGGACTLYGVVDERAGLQLTLRPGAK